MFDPPVIIQSGHEVGNFDCGNAALNEFLQKYALVNTSAGVARTYVVTLTAQPAVVGYYSLAAGSVERDSASVRVAKGTPRHPIPVILLARLAVDSNYQGQGLGFSMLKHALLQSLNAAQAVGVRAVLVHAKNEQAAKFYAKYGFEPSATNALHLMLLFKDVRKTLGLDG